MRDDFTTEDIRWSLTATGLRVSGDSDPVREITESDLLTWQVQFQREGTLPPEVQRRLLEHVSNRGPIVVGVK